MYGANTNILFFYLKTYTKDCPEFSGTEEQISEQRHAAFHERAGEVGVRTIVYFIHCMCRICTVYTVCDFDKSNTGLADAGRLVFRVSHSNLPGFLGHSRSDDEVCGAACCRLGYQFDRNWITTPHHRRVLSCPRNKVSQYLSFDPELIVFFKVRGGKSGSVSLHGLRDPDFHQHSEH